MASIHWAKLSTSHSSTMSTGIGGAPEKPCMARRTLTRRMSGSTGVNTATPDLTARLAHYYHEIQHPALANRPYSKAIMDFTETAILAFGCGYNETDMREQLRMVIGDDAPASQLKGLNESDCVLCISLVWVTLMLSPKTVTRWATASAVSESTMSQWKGFVAMIVTAYFEKRMAWYPIDRLQMELSAVLGRSESPDIVAERARLVFTTLERVHPQFPSV